MHTSVCLHCVLSIAFLPLFSFASQVPLSPETVTSKTLVDVLNADPDYTSLLRLLQRTRLIPTLNKLNGSTLFAPTNEAVKEHASRNLLWQIGLDGSTSDLTDNVQEQLRQQLFYHLLNESLLSLPPADKVVCYKTLLYPRKPLDPPSHDPPPSPPWMPIQNGTLGSEPQKLRLAKLEDAVNVSVDAFGKGGVKIVKDVQDGGNGIVIGINRIIVPPADLAAVIAQHSSVSYFEKIMNPEVKDRLNSSSQLTVFLPVDTAWSKLDPVERLYLESKFATDDLHRILDMHTVTDRGVFWSDSFESDLNLTSIYGSGLNIVPSPEGVKVGDADLIHPDIYASNGVLHLVSSLLIPPGALRLTPQKYLLALNCTKFVHLLDSVGLTNLINDTDTKYTILAPKDDIISIFDDPTFPPSGSEELKKMLQYHFIRGTWTPKKLKQGTLLETALKEPGLGDRSQVVPVDIHSDEKKNAADKSISFGGASIIGDAVEINNTVIYFISQPLVPPSDVLQVALPYLDFSSFLAALSSTSKAEALRMAPSTSFLIPQNEAFKRLGLLVSAHLLSPSSKGDLENVIMHHVLTTVEYADSIRDGSQHTFPTLESSDIKIERLTDGTIFASSSGGWAGFKAELQTRNFLTQTGVIHEMSDIMIPRSVQLTIGKLVKAAKGSTMTTLVNKAGFEWILNGTAPPDGSPWADNKFGNVAWTLLCPPDEAFKEYNLTQLLSDIPTLQGIVSQHLIPTPPNRGLIDGELPLNTNQPLVFDKATYSTVRSADSEYGDLVFEQRSDTQDYVVGIKGARGSTNKEDWARVTAWGRSTVGSGIGGVIQIDRLLIPYQPSWWVEYGAPVTTGLLGIIFICMFFFVVRAIWRRDTTEATYEPIGGFGRDDDDE